MRYKDKLYEAKYRLKRIKEEARSILENVKNLHRFRFEIGAFFSAARSVTWVIKKDLSHKAGFVEFYKKFDKEFKDYKIVIDIRNAIEKEGNKFPLFVLFYRTNDGIPFEMTWDYSGDDIEQMVGYGGQVCPTNVEWLKKLPQKDKDKYFEKINSALLDLLFKNIHAAKREKIRLIFDEEKTKEWEVEEFIEFLNKYYIFLEKIVKEADLFRNESKN